MDTWLSKSTLMRILFQSVEVPWFVVVMLLTLALCSFYFIARRQKEIRWIQKEHESMEVQLRTLEQAQNHLFLNISHDIRTPLNGVLGFSDLIQARLLRAEMTASNNQELLSLTRAIQGYMQSVSEGAHQLSGVIDRLSEASHIAGGGYALPAGGTSDNAPIDSVRMVQRILDRIRPDLDKKKLHVQYVAEGDSTMLGQADLLHQALYQVIENAMKFTPLYGRIQISTFVRDGKGIVRVRDNGCGLAPEHVPFVRHPMGMPADVAVSGRGVGVGLSMTDQIMRRLQGSMKFLPLEGRRGTEVTLIFPVKS